MVKAGKHEKSPSIDWAILSLAEPIGTHFPADKQNSLVHSINTAGDSSVEELSDLYWRQLNMLGGVIIKKCILNDY